ncbi:hypothetical protein GPEL0_01r0119 [Geoanaerobacter pelophilus]|uniref:Uncharacterized protein n=1 Tax=Geoanaerobacter pelophilus TaxID=60036 RepID=A0ABQ0MDV6_9BACT|nr:hypothetical protein GPEL0_01r0119 [Geoanaerobacter pelophilus]
MFNTPGGGRVSRNASKRGKAASGVGNRQGLGEGSPPPPTVARRREGTPKV